MACFLGKETSLKIGFVSLPLTGHLNPMIALARRMNQRGHEAVFFGVPDVESAVRAAGVTFIPYGEKKFPIGSIPDLYAPLAKLRGVETVQYVYEKCSPGLTQAAFDYLPQKLKEAGVEALAIDSVYNFVEIVPMNMGIPYIHIWNILPLDFSGATPICLYSWPNDSGPEALRRNLEGLRPLGETLGNVVNIAMSYAKKVDLEIDWNDPSSTVSKLAIIAQTPKEFDFTGSPWPPHFHYAGPFHDVRCRKDIPFPWEKLNDKPLIYASLGTLVNGLEHIYKTILNVVGQVPEVQVVLSVGTNVNPDDLGPIPANTIVVQAAPQLELLKRASLCITHAGLNTALESLAQGVPMVAIPIGFDQPGIAARIALHGVGEFLDLEDLTADRLLQLVQTVLRNPDYRDRARHFQEIIAQTQGLDVAAGIIEQALQKYRIEDPVREAVAR
jgi:zeaxanthin glucosyltransferase